MRKYDIVYFLKDGIEPDELRYSLRSVEKNFPHGKIWFVGGQPSELKPDVRMDMDQRGITKWEKVRSMLYVICRSSEVSDDFWLFNDDFFILKPWTSTEALYNGTLEEHIKHIEGRHNGQTGYTAQLRECMNELESKGYGTLNYAIHCPMLINKAKMLETLKTFPYCPMFRSLYGNHHNIGGVQHCDCKIAGMDNEPDGEWCSTTGESFKGGNVGKYVRKQFPKKCRYEI